MTPIHLSPATQRVAAEIFERTASGARTIAITDAQLGEAVGLKPDTCYRGVLELERLDAIEPAPRVQGVRRITPRRTHWVWVALSQIEGAR